MADDLLAQAREQAEQSEPPVRAAALMRIARLQSVSDFDLARRTFEQGLNEVRSLAGLDRQFLLEQAQLLAAAVAPDLVRDIPSGGDLHRQFRAERLGRTMLEHEHGDAAFEYVMQYDDPATFPFSVVSALVQWFGDEERRMALLRRAFEAWRKSPEDRFLQFFQWQWNVLPAEEARAAAREIVGVTLEKPDHPIMATYDREGTVQITSGREHALFQLLHVLRRLDGALAERLIAEHEQLGAAARRYPNGMESVMEEAEGRRSQEAGPSCCGYFMAGNPRDFPHLRALLKASQDGDCGPSMERGVELYREDSAAEHPNLAAREFWPSTCWFRSVLYRAGKRLGQEAAVYLDQIPDADLRLFAQVELAAALAGLPELQGTQREYRPRPSKTGTG